MTRLLVTSIILLLLATSWCSAFTTTLLNPNQHPRFSSSSSLHMAVANVGIFFGTSTGTTEEIAEQIKAGLVAGDTTNVEGPFDVDDLEGSVKAIFEKYDCLIVGTPTWNTGTSFVLVSLCCLFSSFCCCLILFVSFVLMYVLRTSVYSRCRNRTIWYGMGWNLLYRYGSGITIGW